MVKPSVRDQLIDVEYAISVYPEYATHLSFQRLILQILQPIDDLPSKGMKVKWTDTIMGELKQQLASGKTIIDLLDASMLEIHTAMTICQEAVALLAYQDNAENNLEKFHRLLKEGKVNGFDFFEAIFKRDGVFFEGEGREYGIEPSKLLYLFSLPIQPCFEEIARRLDEFLANQWRRSKCPVCGRLPPVAWLKNGKRYLTCTYCGAQYLSDLFFCVNCNNTNPSEMGFITFTNHDEYQLDICEKCKHYLKVIHGDKLKEKIPSGLEDILTQKLDAVAKEAGFRRI